MTSIMSSTWCRRYPSEAIVFEFLSIDDTTRWKSQLAIGFKESLDHSSRPLTAHLSVLFFTSISQVDSYSNVLVSHTGSPGAPFVSETSLIAKH